MIDQRRTSNTEFLEYVMTIGGRTGAMKQLVIMDVLEKGVDNIIEAQDELLEIEDKMEAEGKTPIISYRAWVEAAKEIKEMFEQRRS